jgi:alpha-amylase
MYFHVHQPRRLKKYGLLDAPGSQDELNNDYFDDSLNKHYLKKAAENCYFPTNAILRRMLEEHSGEFKASYSVSGVLLEQCEEAAPDVVQSFLELRDTRCVEFLGETFYHSLSSLFFDSAEFKRQVRLHEEKIRKTFGCTPKAFRNTELLYNDGIARLVEKMGFRTVLSEGIERVLEWRSPNYVYRPSGCKKLSLLLRNYKLSDDVGFRFSARGWTEWPLTAPKYAAWLSACNGQTINLFMDYETFGEHHWRESGIFEFLARFPGEVLRHENLSFRTVSETGALPPAGELSVPSNLSWADLERDASAWLGNKMQWSCFHELQKIGSLLEELRAAGCRVDLLREIWGLLQTSDHLLYCCSKSWADGDVHKHFSPYKLNTPIENYANYMNILIDFKNFLERRLVEARRAGAGKRSAAFGKTGLDGLAAVANG